MRSALLTTVLRIRINNMPRSFSAEELAQKGCLMQQDIEALTDAHSILLNTQLAHRFSQEVDEKEHAVLDMLVGLKPKNQLVLDYSFSPTPPLSPMSPGHLEQLILEDRQRLVAACQNLATRTTFTVNEFSQRVAAACLDLPVADLKLELRKGLQSLLEVTTRTWRGRLVDQPWQHDVPAIPKYDWIREIFSVRVMLHRERRGYSLGLLRRDSLGHPLSTAGRLKMPERPRDLEATAALELAEHTRRPVDMMIRVGTLVGSVELVVADFVGFAAPASP